MLNSVKKNDSGRSQLLIALALMALLDSSSMAQTCSTNGGGVALGMNQYVLNNMWNAKSDPAGTESIDVRSPVSWSTTYNWPRVDPLACRCYPSSVLGWQFNTVTPGTGLPVRLSSNTPVVSTTAFNITGSAMQDITYDCWFHSVGNPTSTTKPSDEMMIWEAAYNGPGPLGSLIKRGIAIDGHTWNLYEGWNSFGWEVHSFVIDNIPSGNLSGATLNLTDFTNYLVANRYGSSKPLLGSAYFTGAEFGTEVVFGSGTFNVTNYTCTVERRSASANGSKSASED